jgi:asparagine synthase (glutamine-hydrolysing)
MWTDAMDEPAMNVINILWVTAILQQAKSRGIGVMLEGASGNGTISFETWAVLHQFFRRGRWGKLARTTSGLRRHGDISLRAAARASLAGWLPKRVSRALIPGDPARHQYSPLLPAHMMEQFRANQGIFFDPLNEFQEPRDEMISLFEGLNTASTRAATQAITGIESRDPTADKRIYEFCIAIPPEQYVVGGHSRSLVRRAMRDRLPESTLLRYKRGHQSADWHVAMTEALPELRQEVAAIGRNDAARDAIDVSRMNQLLDTWPASGYEGKAETALWRDALTRAISMGYFLRTHGCDGEVR